MEIVKKGSPHYNEKKVKFMCKECGCIFIATKDEYQYHSSPKNEIYYTCDCPECRVKSYNDNLVQSDRDIELTRAFYNK